jgi:hypothetical protein
MRLIRQTAGGPVHSLIQLAFILAFIYRISFANKTLGQPKGIQL